MEAIAFPDWDFWLLKTINSAHAPFMDSLMVLISSLALWFPLYGFLLYKGIREYGWQVWRLVLAAVLVIALADQVSSTVLKPKIARLRPCHDPTINSEIRQPGGCGGKYGFVSSHAANTFGLAALIVLLWGVKYWIWLFVWAFLVSYSRVYLGVHYPLDVMGGGFLGITMALVVYWIYVKGILRGSLLKINGKNHP